ncbi:hypothetical protein [Alkalihalobacillus sp. AL-G]|uniref:hypothetical protein n=1 Tax=Alkalihalobacillus sp. AL-G TaxID=2926399 RepID=UPI00272BB546|nr:hypothetical protein [Alkalihalobacillus sp. AL-G]WLD93655.1 hypothetical protein MOJ78_01570 [Alkalihalobacillus sp. AL-G]
MGKMNNLFYNRDNPKGPVYTSDELAQSNRMKYNNMNEGEKSYKSSKDLHIDDQQNKWYYYRIDEKGKFDLVGFNPHSGSVMKKVVYGTPNIYEFPEHIIVACEGNGETGAVYQFSKDTLMLVQEWEIDGFIWDVKMVDHDVCVSAYVVDLDTARLYILKGRSIDFVELGTHFAPADLLVFQGNLFISAYPIVETSPRKILRLDDEFAIVDEYKVSVCPRFLFENGDEILIQELDVKTGRSDRYSSLNIKTGEEIISRRKRPKRTKSLI